MRQAYDYWQDQPDSYRTPRVLTHTAPPLQRGKRSMRLTRGSGTGVFQPASQASEPSTIVNPSRRRKTRVAAHKAPTAHQHIRSPCSLSFRGVRTAAAWCLTRSVGRRPHARGTTVRSLARSTRRPHADRTHPSGVTGHAGFARSLAGDPHAPPFASRLLIPSATLLDCAEE